VVKVDYPVDLRLVAECVDATLEDLEELNPSLLRRTTPKDQAFELHLPQGSLEKYMASIEAIPRDKRVSWRYYKVQPGDTLAAIARKYHATERSIAEANGLQDSTVARDARLVIPVSTVGLDKVHYSRYASHYKVHTGDTVLTVAEDYGVPPESLRRWNHLKGNDLRRGRLLVIYKPLGPGDADKAPVRHSRKRSPATAAKKKAVTAGRKESLNARTP